MKNIAGLHRVICALGALGVASSFIACDAIIGIDELTTPPPPNNGLSCATPADCPATGNPCFLRACTSQGICELRDVEPGFVVEVQTPGDCNKIVCQSSAAIDTFDATDTTDDGNLCTTEICVEGVGLQTAPSAAGSDCGGLVCDGASNCVQCIDVDDCLGGGEICQSNQCVPATCNDNIQSGTETDIDCGGRCLACENGLDCDVDADCLSGVCNGTCQAPDCNDDTLIGDETDVDCGGSCPGCKLNEMCLTGDDCIAALNYCVCGSAMCTCETPSCHDTVENGTELDVDCGPSCVGDPLWLKCLDGMPCINSTWCQSGVCDEDAQECLAPTCEDGVANGDEGGIDCDCPTIQDIPDCAACTTGCPG